MKSEQWRGLFWSVGLGGYLSVFFISILSSDIITIFMLVFGSHMIILPSLFWIQKKINQAMEREGITWVDIAVRQLERAQLNSKHHGNRPKYVEIVPEIKPGLSEEERKKAEQMLRDWQAVQEEMK